jgi:hypothetical protein
MIMGLVGAVILSVTSTFGGAATTATSARLRGSPRAIAIPL